MRTMYVKRWRQELTSWAVLDVTEEAATLVQTALILALFDYCEIAWSKPFTARYRSTYSAYRIDLHGLSHVALAYLEQYNRCTGRLFQQTLLPQG